MSNRYKTAFVVCAALLSTTIATSAHAENAFNKFPLEKGVAQTEWVHASNYVEPVTTIKLSSKSKTRIKRVVKPVPAKPTNRIAFVTEQSSVMLTDGFNKMSPSEGGSRMATPVFIDNNAKRAR